MLQTGPEMLWAKPVHLSVDTGTMSGHVCKMPCVLPSDICMAANVAQHHQAFRNAVQDALKGEQTFL